MLTHFGNFLCSLGGKGPFKTNAALWSVALSALIYSAQQLQHHAAMLPFLLCHPGKNLPIFRIAGACLIPGKALHFPAIAPAQDLLRISLRRRHRLHRRALAGGEGVDPLQASGMGLLLLIHFSQKHTLRTLKMPGKL